MKKINSLTLGEYEIITSYDVSVLFTSIPPDDVIQGVRNCLIKDTNLSEWTDLTVEQIVELYSYPMFKDHIFFVQWPVLFPTIWLGHGVVRVSNYC